MTNINQNRVTLKSLAHRLGLSTTTVSRALNGKGRRYRISKKTEERIVEEAKKLNFYPNQLARGLRTNKTFTIGLIIPDISNPFFANIAHNIEVESRKLGYAVFLCDSQENTDIEIESLRLLESRNVDGLIISPVGQTCEHLKKFENSDIPIVIVDRYFPNLRLPSVASDNFHGAYNAVQHLLENGHERILCLQGLDNTTPNEMRVRGYRTSHSETNIEVDNSLIVGDRFDDRSGYVYTKQALREKKHFSAIFALSNLIALGALRALAESRLQVPQDISIVSFDDYPYSGYLATPMTTIRQNNNAIGKTAVKLLFEQFDSQKRTEKKKLVFVPTELIVRKSVKNLSRNIKDKSKSCA
jgi:LacI family transcriptional regulator